MPGRASVNSDLVEFADCLPMSNKLNMNYSLLFKIKFVVAEL